GQGVQRPHHRGRRLGARRRGVSDRRQIMRLYTHLNFGGNCEEAFRFYERNLGGTITMMMKADQLPAGVTPPGGKNAVIHARMSLAGVALIWYDVPSDHFK